MKLHRLEVEGFGPFRAPQTVDFDAFEDDGIFLISGRTGSGKSSILDAVCFALFGSVPRYEASEKRIRSDHSTPDDATRVSLEFTAAGRRWRLTRSPEYERPKARGGGLTPVPHSAQLDELSADGWQTRATRPREVAHLLDELVGLNQQQFLQVILLAQGRFAQFLLAKNDERQTLLRTLFGTRVYQEYQVAFEERRKVAARALERGGDGLRMLRAEAQLLIDEYGFGGEAHDGVERAVERAAYRAETLTREADVAEDAHAAAATRLTSLTTLRARQVERLRSRRALEELDQEEPAIAADRVEHEQASAAESLRPPIESAARARADAERAVAAERAACAAWIVAGGSEGDIPALRELIDAMTGDLTLWQAAADQEPALREASAAAERHRRAVEDSEAALAQLDARGAELPAQRRAIDTEAGALEGAGVALETARVAQQSTQQRLAAARDAALTAQGVTAAEHAHADRLETLERTTREVTALLRRRLAGYAGELAQSLVDGEPCAVCGAREHPAPADHTDAPVTDEMIADAEALKEAAAAAESAASATARAARAAHAEADALAGGASPAEMEAALDEATTAIARARMAAERRDELAALRDALLELETAVHEEHDALTAHLVASREAAALSDQAVSGLQASVDSARGDFATVAERISAVTRRRRLARDLAEKCEVRAARSAAAAEAEDDRDTWAEASVFPDVRAAVDALRDPAKRKALGERIHRHEVSLATERDRLRDLELELAGEPDDPIDLDPVAAAVASARTVWREAAALAARAAQAAERLGALAARIASAHAETAELEAAHDLVAGLANAVAGRTASRMDLETFVLAAELEEIVAAANLRLDEMSSGRYRLQHSDAVAVRNGASGLGLQVLDAYTGRARPPQSLSGGETFLASLALALGLAEVVTARAGGLRLDTLFVDEGFGSLDAETLELAMRTLDELRQGGRTVGVISHVEAMKEQLPAQLRVHATPAGPSVIRQDVVQPV